MDVPDSGAVFTYGRSHLTISGDGHDNNYFFVKRDPIRKLVCGRSQSAVICESGRLFVWGENPCGQLAIGTCENIVTKPSCVKYIKKLGHQVKDFQFGSNFSILLTDTNKVFYAGKNIFPFNAKIESLDGKLQHDITELPVELTEFGELEEKFASLRTGDEHFVLMNHARDKLIGWGFNAHHQLAMIDSLRVLSRPDVFFEADDGEVIKLVECGKLSTCVVTESNDLYIVGRFGFTTISTFTKIREPIVNSIITQLCISDDDDIFLVTEDGCVYKSNDFRNIIELRFEQMNFSGINEKIRRIASGMSFLSAQTETGRCFSFLSNDKSIVESAKLNQLRVVDICSGNQHVLVAVVPRRKGEDEIMMLNKTYTINFKGAGDGAENCQHPNGNDSIAELDETLRSNASRATTLECRDYDSPETQLSPEHHDDDDGDETATTIRFVDEGVDKSTSSEGKMNGSVTLLIDDSTTCTTDSTTDDDGRAVARTKTPMPRAARKAAAMQSSDDDLNEEGIIDRDEDEFRNEDDDDDVSSSTAEHSSDSLEEYIQEEQRINAENALKGAGGDSQVEKVTRWRKLVLEFKEKGRGLSCKNVDNVISEERADSVEKAVEVKESKEISENNKNSSAACLMM